MASQLASPAIAERFTIGRVLAQSCHAFMAGWRWFLPISFIVSAASIVHAELASYANADAISSPWSYFLTLWISLAIQSLAIAPIVLRVLNPDEARLGTMLQFHYWTRTLKIVIATCIVQIAVYWPVVAMILRVASGPALIWFGLFAANIVAVGTILSLFYAVFLAEQRSLLHSALRSVRQVKPHAWQMAALVILYRLLEFGGGVAIARLLNLFDASIANWLDYALQCSFMAFLILTANIVSAVAYRLLRSEREGLEPKHVAVVFE